MHPQLLFNPIWYLHQMFFLEILGRQLLGLSRLVSLQNSEF